MESFTFSLAGIGGQITKALAALGPVALFVAALIVALAVGSWFANMVERVYNPVRAELRSRHRKGQYFTK